MRAEKSGINNFGRGLLSLALLIITLSLPFFISHSLSRYFYEGALYAVRFILPVTLPFFIVADYYSSIGAPERISPLAKGFSLLFGLPAVGVGAYAIGAVAGFPTGAKMSCALCKSGEISKKDAIRLSALSNNPSLAFLVGVVAKGNASYGIRLICSVLLSSLLTGLITRGKVKFAPSNKEKGRKRISNPTDVVKDAALSSLYLTAFVALFYSITKLLCSSIQSIYIKQSIAALCELCSAVGIIGNTCSGVSSMALGFALGFGGLSVIMQSSVFLKDAGLCLKEFTLYKLIQGFICAPLTLLLINA